MSGPARLRGRRLAGVAALALLALALARVSGFFTDDSYIHLVFARNLSAGQGFTFNPGEPVYGFTSPLWVLLLAAGHALAPGAGWFGVARLLGLLFTLLAVLWTFRLAGAAHGSVTASVVAASALGFHAWFLRWSLSGMETSLAAFLAALGLERVLRGGRAAGWGLFALGLGALARPEMLLLFLLALVIPSPGGKANLRARIAGAGAALAALAGWEWWIHRATGAWIPTSFSVKRAHEALDWSGVLRPTAHFLGVVGITDALLLLVVLLAVLRIRRRGAPLGALGLLCAWPLALASLYLLTRFQMISRYWVPALPAVCVAACVGAERAMAPVPRRLALGAYFAQQAALFVLLVVPQMDAFTRGLGTGPAAIGRWLSSHAPPGATVATPDIGAVGFYARRRVLDLGGLVTPAMGPLLARYDLGRIVGEGLYESIQRADFLVDRDLRPGVLTGPRYELVLETRVENLGLSRPEPRYYSLYRVHPPAPGRPGAP